MDEAVTGTRNYNKLVVVAVGIIGLLFVVGAIWWFASRPPLISPLSESGGDTRIVFMTPEPRASAETEATPSAQPKGSPSPKAAAKSSPKATPKSSPKSSPRESPTSTSSASPSASAQ